MVHLNNVIGKSTESITLVADLSLVMSVAGMQEIRVRAADKTTADRAWSDHHPALLAS